MPLASLAFNDLLSQLAAKTPTPGGGAAACAAGAIAAALAGMVVSFSVGKKALADHQPALADAQARLGRARELLLNLGDEDAEAYALLNELQRLPAGDARRAAEEPAALAAAIGVPMAALAACADVAALLATLPGITNPHLRSDLLIAAILTDAAAESCAANVRVNLPLLTNTGERERQAALATQITRHAHDKASATRAGCAV